MRVALIEDSAQFLRVMEALLAELPEATVVGTASDAPAAIELVHRTNPDLVLLDLYLREGTGIDVLESLGERSNHMAVIVVTNEPSAILEAHCRKLGARAFLDKTTQLEELARLLEEQAFLEKNRQSE